MGFGKHGMEQPPNKSIILMKVGIIIAKSFSKRVPNKNFMNFNGKPMIYWTIQAAKKSRVFDKIIIATDNNKIITKLKKYDLDFIKRPKELSKEKYGIDEVMNYSLSTIKERVDYACCLFPCAPLMSHTDIIKGFSKQIYQVFTNRENGLKKALAELFSDDILIIFGKGNEEYQEIDGKKIYYSDRKIIESFYAN